MFRSQMKKLIWRSILQTLIILSAGFALHAQEKKTIAIIPVKGSILAESENWIFIRHLDDFLQRRNKFDHVGSNVVQQYFQSYSIPVESDADELKNIADDLKVSLLLLVKVIKNDEERQLKASLFDVQEGVIRKTAVETCDCLSTDAASFPFEKVAEILFDAPEIILSSMIEKAAPLPLPTAIELPTAPVVVDTTAKKEEPVTPGIEDSTAKKGGGAWKRYALGAALVGGGVLYFATKGGSGDGDEGALSKLDDPPSPPNTGSN